MSDCLNIFLQKHQVPFDGTYLSNYGTITREQFAKSFSTRVLGEFYERSFEEQIIIIDKLKQLRHSFSSDFQQKLHSKYLMNASFFDRDKYYEELYEITRIGLNSSPIGNYGYLQLIHLMLKNLEPRQYAEYGWFRSMMFDFYDCMLKVIIHSPAPDAALAQIESHHDKKTEISTPDKNGDDSSKSLSFERFIEKSVRELHKKEISPPHKREILLTPDNFEFKGFNMDWGYKQVNTKKNKDSKKGGNKKTNKNKHKKQKNKNKHKKTKRKL
jgi:hypothetical protein